MTSLHKFLKGSSQFKNLASNLFNHNFVLDHFAYRSFNIEKYPHYKRETGEKNIYKFTNNVSTTWLSKKDYPSIFVSQYEKISDDAEIKNVIDTEILEQYINNNTPPDYEIYKKNYDHNQYLGWTLHFLLIILKNTVKK